MHENDIMHRDLKPENIMFKNKSGTDELKIVDLGLATKTTAKTFKYPKCGTPGYVAPEIANLHDLT
jgi:calcium-dependent protein kinase